MISLSFGYRTAEGTVATTWTETTLSGCYRVSRAGKLPTVLYTTDFVADVKKHVAKVLGEGFSERWWWVLTVKHTEDLCVEYIIWLENWAVHTSRLVYETGKANEGKYNQVRSEQWLVNAVYNIIDEELR